MSIVKESTYTAMYNAVHITAFQGTFIIEIYNAVHILLSKDWCQVSMIRGGKSKEPVFTLYPPNSLFVTDIVIVLYAFFLLC